MKKGGAGRGIILRGGKYSEQAGKSIIKRNESLGPFLNRHPTSAARKGNFVKPHWIRGKG